MDVTSVAAHQSGATAARTLRRELLPLAIGGVVVIAMLVFQLQARGILILLFAAAVGAMGLVTVIRPAIGLAAIVATASVVRVKIGTGTDSPIVASLIIAGALLAAWVVHNALNRRRMLLLPRSLTIYGFILIGFTLFSLLWGRVTLDPRVIYPPGFYRVQIAAAALSVVSVGLLFVGADLLRARTARTLLVASIIVIGFVALPFRAFGDGTPYVNTAGIFGIWFVALCWANALGNQRLPVWMRTLLGAGAIGWLLMAFLREGNWVSGWLPALLAFQVVTLVMRPRLGIAILLIGLFGCAAYFSVFYDLLVTRQEHDGSLGGEFGRIELWRRNLSVIQGRLTFGTGPAGYALYYVTFFPSQAMSTHSNYVDTLAQFGIGGLVGLVGVLGSLWTMGWRLLARVTESFDRAQLCASLGGIAGVAVSLWLGDWLIPFVYNQTIAGFDHAVYSWLMFAALCGLYAQTRSEALEQAHA